MVGRAEHEFTCRQISEKGRWSVSLSTDSLEQQPLQVAAPGKCTMHSSLV